MWKEKFFMVPRDLIDGKVAVRGRMRWYKIEALSFLITHQNNIHVQTHTKDLYILIHRYSYMYSQRHYQHTNT